jgi:hypothetical protein
MGNRREKPGLYRCRKCKSVLQHEKRRDETVFYLRPAGAGSPDLLTIPRV